MLSMKILSRVLHQFDHNSEDKASALFYSVALLFVWKDVCICFNTVALFLLWFVRFFGGMGTRFSGEYCLMPSVRIVQWSQLNAAFESFGWSGQKRKMPVAGEERSGRLPGLKCNLLICISKLEEKSDVFRGPDLEMCPNIPQMGWMQR